MTALLAINLDGFIVLGADQLQVAQIDGRIVGGRLHRKIVLSADPQFMIATGGSGSLDPVRVTAATAPTMKPSSEYVADLVRAELNRSGRINLTSRKELARELQALLRRHVQAQDANIREAEHRLNVFTGYKVDGAAQFLQFEVLNTRDVEPDDIHLNDTDCSFFPESLRPYFQRLPALPDRRLQTVIEHVRRVLRGAIDQEQRTLGDQANVGGDVDIAVIDAAGVRFV